MTPALKAPEWHYLVSVDPGLTDLGLAVYRVKKRLFRLVCELQEVHHFGSKPVKGAPKTQDTGRRLLQLGDFLQTHLDCACPLIGVASEEPTPLRSSTDNAKLVSSWALVIEQCRSRSVSHVALQPKAMREFYSIPARAEKTATQEKIRSIFPDFAGWPSTARETPHCHDAAAIGYAALHLHEDLFLSRL